MTYRALYAGSGPGSSPLTAVARIDGNKVDVIFVDSELFECTDYWPVVVVWSMPFNLTIEEPVQWDDFIESDEQTWLAMYEQLNDYNLTLLPE